VSDGKYAVDGEDAVNGGDAINGEDAVDDGEDAVVGEDAVDINGAVDDGKDAVDGEDAVNGGDAINGEDAVDDGEDAVVGEDAVDINGAVDDGKDAVDGEDAVNGGDAMNGEDAVDDGEDAVVGEDAVDINGAVDNGEDAMSDSDAHNCMQPRKARSYDRTMVCFYCDKTIKLNMPRHLRRVHGNEPDVARLLACRDAEEQKLGFARITNRGNFKHNCTVIETGEGDLIVGRQPTKTLTLSDKIQSYLPCVHCCVMFLKHDLWRHAQNCRFKPSADDTNPSNVVVLSRMMLRGAVQIRNSTTVNQGFKNEVLKGMRNDDITTVVLGDEIILKYGQSLHQRLGKNRAHDISQRMRQLGRLVTQINSLQNEGSRETKVSLSECLSGSMFDTVVQATCVMSVPSNSALGRPLFNNPSIGLKLGHALVKCAEVKKGIGIRQDDDNTIKEADAFLSLHKSEWTSSVSAHSLATFKFRKYNKPTELPSVSDLLKLKAYQETKMQKLTDSILLQPSYGSWRELCEVVFTRLVIFNRRRSGETAKLNLSAYENRPRWEEVATDEIKTSLTALEKQLLKRYTTVSFLVFFIFIPL